MKQKVVFILTMVCLLGLVSCATSSGAEERVSAMDNNESIVEVKNSAVVDENNIVIEKSEINKDDPNEWYLAALQLIGNEEYELALVELKTLVKAYPEYYWGYKQIVEVYNVIGDLESAENYLRELEETSCTLWALGLLKSKEKAFDDSVGYLKKAIENGPCFLELILNLVVIYPRTIHEQEDIYTELENFFIVLLNEDENNSYLYIGLGYISGKKKQYATALEYYDKSYQLDGNVDAYARKGYAYSYMNDSGRAINVWIKTLVMLQEQKVRDFVLESKITFNIGLNYYYIRDWEQSTSYFHQAIERSKRIGYHILTCSAFNELGNASLASEGPTDSTISYLLEAYKLSESIGYLYGAADSLMTIGKVYGERSNYYEAVMFYQKALDISEEINDFSLLARGHQELSIEFMRIGYLKKAREEAEIAYSLGKAHNLSQHISESLGCLGTIYLNNKDFTKAIEYLLEGLEELKNLPYKRRERVFYNMLSLVYYEKKEYNTALKYLDQTLQYASDDYRGKIAKGETLWIMGNIYFKKGEFSLAEEYYHKAYDFADTLGNYYMMTFVKLGLGKLYLEQGTYSRALDILKEVIESTEILRSSLKKDDYKLGFLAGKIQLYNTLISLLLEMHQIDPSKGYQNLAFYYSQSSKSRALLDLLANSGIDQNETDQLTSAEPLTLQEVQVQLINNNTVLLEYKQLEDRLLLWKITRDDTQFFEIPISEVDLADIVYPFLDKFESNPSSFSRSAFKVYTIILASFLEDIPEGSTLLISADGILQKIPFEALVMEDTGPQAYKDLEYVVKKYPVSYIQSASVMELLRKGEGDRIPSKDLFAIGDPVFNPDEPSDETVALRSFLFGEELSTLDRLAYSGIEVETIGGFFDKKDVYTRFDATEERVKESLEDYRYIHLATHGKINNYNSAGSGLVFTQDDDPAEDGFLQMSEILDLKLNADLVVLSACETGLGEYIQGEGLVNLTRAFMYAGAESVAVTLWRINDKETAELMIEFYRNLKSGKSKNQALRGAKLSMLEKAPHYWAGFVLYGN